MLTFEYSLLILHLSYLDSVSLMSMLRYHQFTKFHSESVKSRCCFESFKSCAIWPQLMLLQRPLSPTAKPSLQSTGFRLIGLFLLVA